ncbi:hypothetical protein DFH09DRAFT_1148231 [Mycena vulgaris]|nr:hypothetical protein DFH09DRAFT_1148231 [Mycena vulgaris]
MASPWPTCESALKSCGAPTIFKRPTFFITSTVSSDDLREIIWAHGGKAVVGTVPTARGLVGGRHLIGSIQDGAVLKKLATAHPVYSPDFIFMNVLRQVVDWESDTFKLAFS